MGFPCGSTPAMQELKVRFLGWEDLLEEGMTTHSSILSWRILWTEEPDGLQSIGSQIVGHDWSDLAHTHVLWKSLSSEMTYIPHFTFLSLNIPWMWSFWPSHVCGIPVFTKLGLISPTNLSRVNLILRPVRRIMKAKESLVPPHTHLAVQLELFSLS